MSILIISNFLFLHDNKTNLLYVDLKPTPKVTGAYFRLLAHEQIDKQLQEQKQQQSCPPPERPRDQTLQSSEKTTYEEQTIRRIRQALEEVALSITMTTTTTLLAFMLGSASSIPAVRWLCWYAASCLFVLYLYQITCFVALIVLDERRVHANRRDLCFWIAVPLPEDEEDGVEQNSTGLLQDASNEDKIIVDVIEAHTDRQRSDVEGRNQNAYSEGDDRTDPSSQSNAVTSMTRKKTRSERFMGCYANLLLKPVSKAIVLAAFIAYTVGTVYSTTLLHQEFNIKDYIPKDSFLTSFSFAYEDYSTVFRYIGVYFRNVDQSDPFVQRQMLQYVEELSQMHEIGEDPAFFWLRDFAELAYSNPAAGLKAVGIDLANMSFNEQIDVALSIPQLRQIYGNDIVRDPKSGNITASRTYLYMRNIDMYNIPDQIDTLMNQRDITLRQPMNKNAANGGLNFFTFDDLYFYWELYATVVDELIFTTISCVIVVTVIGFILIPHWSAVCFVCPLLIMLYFNLLGKYPNWTNARIDYFFCISLIE